MGRVARIPMKIDIISGGYFFRYYLRLKTPRLAYSALKAMAILGPKAASGGGKNSGTSLKRQKLGESSWDTWRIIPGRT